MSTTDRKAELEQRYIRLLEMRIAELEAIVIKPHEEKSEEGDDGKSDKDGKKDEVSLTKISFPRSHDACPGLY